MADLGIRRLKMPASILPALLSPTIKYFVIIAVFQKDGKNIGKRMSIIVKVKRLSFLITRVKNAQSGCAEICGIIPNDSPSARIFFFGLSMSVGQKKNGKTAARSNMRSRQTCAVRIRYMSILSVRAMPSVERRNFAVARSIESCR